MSTLPERPEAQPQLRLWKPDSQPSPATPDAADDSSLSGDLTLSAFFEQWFLPVILQGEKNAALGTVRGYREALGWWARLTGDPPLRAVDEFTGAAFRTRLRQATYRRGRCGQQRMLSPARQATLLRTLNSVLHRTGPTTHPRRKCKALVDEALHFTVSKPQHPLPKPCFCMATARKVVATAVGMQWGPRASRAQRPIPPVAFGDWLTAWLSVLYYTGLRVGTVLQLRWEHVRENDRGVWLHIPAAVVSKTHKGLVKWLHPAAAQALRKVRTADLMLPSPYCYDYLAELHAKLQARAGVPADAVLSPHAWRRTFGTEMFKVGAQQGLAIAQRALDHADDATTQEFYVCTEPLLIQRLPPLIGQATQLRLF